MKIIAYGEDALTLWALKEKLQEILKLLNDDSEPSCCQIFYRPSFGRGSSGFGEFDFILLADQVLYLGESKWNKSGEKKRNGTLRLRDKQITRHNLFIFYLKKWAFGDYTNWDDFLAKEQAGLVPSVHSIPDEKSLLAKNLRAVLDIIKKHYLSQPIVKNLLLFLLDGKVKDKIKCEDFEVVLVNYSEVVAIDNFLRLAL